MLNERDAIFECLIGSAPGDLITTAADLGTFAKLAKGVDGKFLRASKNGISWLDTPTEDIEEMGSTKAWM